MEYADDICFVSHKYEHMQKKMDGLWEESKEDGLEINQWEGGKCSQITQLIRKDVIF